MVVVVWEGTGMRMMKGFISPPPPHSRRLSQSVKPCFPDKAANRNESMNVHAHNHADAHTRQDMS